MNNKKRLQELSALVLDKPEYLHMKTGELKKHINEISNGLDREWIESGFSDFSLYHRPDYLYSVINCYFIDSRNSIRKALKFFKENNIDISELEVFDDYNGLGFTTLDLIESDFKNVSYFNDVDIQLEAFNKVLDFYNLEKPYLDKDKSGKYDIVFSMEIAEHNQEPDEYMDEIMKMVKPGGWLILAQTFNPKWLGHFETYKVNGKIYKARKAGAENWRRVIANGFDLVDIGFNGPFFFRKRTDNKPGIKITPK